tara:strand:- start:5750 stop:6193 length:444 start_codon:yes stop_codon:yes gene_type:complete
MATPSSAFIKGWTFNYDSTPDATATYLLISEVTEVSGLGQTYPQVDVTNFDSTAKEYIGGLADGSEVSVTANFLPGDASQVALTAVGGDNGSGSVFGLQFISTDGTTTNTYTFDVVNLGYEISPSVDDKNSISFTFKITGAITLVSA